MKKLVTTFCTVAALALVANASFAGAVRISQAYAGGGGGSSSYLYDYVELFNSSAVPVDISGWTIEYGSATGNWGSSSGNIYTFPAGTLIQPCKYLLIQTGGVSTSPSAQPFPVPADLVTAGLGMGNTNGKLALFNAVNSNLACGAELPGTLEDKLAWGTGNCPEGTAIAPFADQVSVAVRNNGGMDDANNNVADFVTFPTGSVAPNNSASPANVYCLATPSMKGTWGALKSIYR